MVLSEASLSFPTAIPVAPLDAYLGWPCAFSGPESRYRHLYSIGMYLLVTQAFGECKSFDVGDGQVANCIGAHAVVAIVLGLVTFIVRYRRQRNRLLRVIIREGGLFLALTLGNGLLFHSLIRFTEYDLSPKIHHRIGHDTKRLSEQCYL